MKITLLTAGKDVHYALNLLSGLMLQKLKINFIGGDIKKIIPFKLNENVSIYNLRGNTNQFSSFRVKSSVITFFSNDSIFF